MSVYSVLNSEGRGTVLAPVAVASCIGDVPVDEEEVTADRLDGGDTLGDGVVVEGAVVEEVVGGSFCTESALVRAVSASSRC